MIMKLLLTSANITVYAIGVELNEMLPINSRKKVDFA